MAKKTSFYSQTPQVPKKKIAGENPIGVVIIGVRNSPTVPAEGGKSRGFGPPSGKTVHPKRLKGTVHYEHPEPTRRLGGKTEGPQKQIKTLNNMHKIGG